MERERYDIKAIIVGVAISIIVSLLVTVVSYSFKMYFLLRRFPVIENKVEDSAKRINNLNNSVYRLNYKIESIKSDIEGLNRDIDSTNSKLNSLELRHQKLLRYVIDNSKILKRNEKNTADKELVSR